MAYSFAESLRAIRLRKGMTQEQVALACGWSGQSRVANYESTAPSGRQPKPNEIPMLAKALGVPVAELFGEHAPPIEPKSHTGRIDPDILHEAITLLVHDERAGKYAPRAQSIRLAELYQWVAADGGRLTADSNREFERQVEARQGGRKVEHKDKRHAADRGQ